MTHAIAAKATVRILYVDCPLCGAELKVEVVGVPLTVRAQEWIAGLAWTEQEELHVRHEASGDGDDTVVTQRARTRNITEPLKGES